MSGKSIAGFDSMLQTLYYSALMFELTEQIFIDNVRFAQSGRTLRGIIQPVKLERLHDVASDGEVAFTLSGCMLKGQLFLEVEILGWLKIVCQRCLEDLRWPIEIHLKIEIVEESQLGQQSEIFDDIFDQIPANPAMNVAELVEDEILLSLPFSPMHAETDCGKYSPVKPLDRNDSAFAVIAGLDLKSFKEF